MAAKQGLTAHLSQASEDARRAVLSRAPTAIKSHSWLSNLNTTCTIKSAPPRTPEVMTLLSNKSGWLVKRNEQQVWQRRWCCVVPHTFLYYFEAEPVSDDGDDGTREGFSGGGVYRSGAVVVENQDELNAAVRDGCKGKGSRDSTPLKGRDGISMYTSPSGDKVLPASVRGPTTTNGNLSPAGIIDLECYSCVNRSSRNDCVFELTGDEITNPDLRSFYFQAGSVEDCEIWTNALLSDRHSALRDEREAYRQVCESFQLQLQNLSDMIDEAEAKTSETETQLYNVRSGAEKFRSQIVNIVREALEQKGWTSVKTDSKNPASKIEELNDHLEKTRLHFLYQIDEVISSTNIGTTKNTGALITQVLADYLTTVMSSYTELGVEVTSMEHELSRSAGVDKAAVTDLKLKLKKMEAERDQERAQHESNIAKLSLQVKEFQRTNEELENQLQTQRVEFTMFQSQAKSKLQELSGHKKILKKEVINLRKKIDEIGSERDAALHITDSHKLQADTEKEKNAMLEKYIEKMENQVTMQQNMMEMISLSGMSQLDDDHGGGISRSNSVVGKIIGAPDDGSFSGFGFIRQPSPSPRMIRDSLRDPSPYRLPPRSRIPPSEHAPPPSPVRQKRVNSIPMTPPESPKGSNRQASYSNGEKHKYTERTPRRGTLDHELMGNQTNSTFENNMPSSSDSHNSLTHEERVNRYNEAVGKKNNHHTPKQNGHRLDNVVADDDDDDHDDHDDDNKSNVSELTEDRTQRAFDKNLQERQASLQYTMSDTTGENVIDGIPGKSQILPQSSQDSNTYPPRFILGAPAEDRPDDNRSSKSNAESTTNGTKLSVAQRARLAAERNANKVDINVQAETMRLQEARERQHVVKPPPPKTRSQSPGMFSNLASMISKKTADTKSLSSNTTEGKSEEVTLTLAERQQKQRERQLRVLREQGLLRDGQTISSHSSSQK